MDGKSATSFAVVISQHDAAAWLVSISTKCDRAIIMWPVSIGRSMSQKWGTLSRRMWYILHETAGNSYAAQHLSGEMNWIEMNSLDETCSSIKRSVLKAVHPNYETPIYLFLGAPTPWQVEKQVMKCGGCDRRRRYPQEWMWRLRFWFIMQAEWVCIAGCCSGSSQLRYIKSNFT